ncbi:MAG: amino acid ABC transporter permease, partial [Synechococcus sp.]
MTRWIDRLITLSLVALLGWAGWSVLHWLLHGADWSVVSSNLPLYAVGSYPADQRWRPLLWITGLIALMLLTLAGPRKGIWRQALPIAWLATAPLGLWLLAGGLGLLPVGTRDWGGLTLTVLLTMGSGLLALPLGVLLALGRR